MNKNKISFLLVLGLISFQINLFGQAVLNIEVLNLKEDSVEVYYYSVFSEKKAIKQKLINNKSSFNLPVNSIINYSIAIDNHFFSTLIKNKDTLNFKVNMGIKNPDKTVEFIGKNAANSKLISFSTDYETNYKREFYRAIVSHFSNDYRFFRKQNKYLLRFIKKAYKKQRKYNADYDALEYVINQRTLLINSNKDLRFTSKVNKKHFYDLTTFYHFKPIESYTLLDLEDMKNSISFEVKKDFDIKDTLIKGNFIVQQFNYVIDNIDGDFKNLLLTNMMIDFIENYPKHYVSSNWGQKIIEKYFTNIQDSSLISIVKVKLKNKEVLKLGSKAPDFTIYDSNGNSKKLSDLKGKVLYIDFWASWCGPCIQEIPYAKVLKEQFIGKDVVFLNISLDANKEDWIKAVEKRKISGENYWIGGIKEEELVRKLYNFNGIPHYLIVNKNGNMFSDNATRPSHKLETTKLLEEALIK